MNTYGICIGRYISGDGFLFCMAENKMKAREQGRLYKKQWKINDPILAVVEIPAHVAHDHAYRREYAANVAAQTAKGG